MLFLSFPLNIVSQVLFHQDIFYGGVTGGGFSSGIGNGANGQFILNIEQNSTIRKAFLFSNRFGESQPVDVNLNSKIYNFNLSNQVGKNFLTFPNTTDTTFCAVHAIDITNEISPLDNIYNISFPNQNNTNPSHKYGAFYLLILYENSFLPKINTSIFINQFNESQNTNYNLTKLNPINNNNAVGLAIHSDIIWNTSTDGTSVSINGNNIGIIEGSDNVNNLWTGAGVKGHFYYQNDSIFGLDDDTPDSLMNSSDGLADIKSYLNNNDDSLNINLIYTATQTKFNIYISFPLTYTTNCDTFSTSISTTNDTICPWGSAQLQATGGSQYSWFGAFGGLNDTSIANPIANPPQTTTYICTITNDSGCVKTEQVKIWVDPCVGINELNENNNWVDIYPNPTNGNITLTSDNTIETVTIHNLIGTEVFKQTNIASNSLNLSLNLPNALYFISIKTANGTVVKKLVKQ